MANWRQKPAELLTNRRGGRGRGLVVQYDPARPPPARIAPPPGLGPEAARQWRSFWRSPVAWAVAPSDHERLRHWARAVDERYRIAELIKARPLVRNAAGTPILNPLSRRWEVLSREIERAEDHFGMTPLSRFRLHFQLTEATSSALRAARMSRDVRDEELEIVDLDAR